MQNAVIKLFPRALARFQFINRGQTEFPEGFGELLSNEVKKMANLALTPEEKSYLQKQCSFLEPTYIDFLMGYRYDPSEVKIAQIGTDLEISVEGYWYRTILWEVPLMSLISELYFKIANKKIYDTSRIIDIAKEKITRFNLLGVSVADFGTRRRYSFDNQDRIVKTLKSYGETSFIGTSNVYFAKKYNLIPVGTHAHEWFMFHAAKYGYKMANSLALDNWVEVYRGDLGIALSDTFTTDVFFQSFDTKFAKLFDGVRQDSGDPLDFAEKTINHYKSLRIDPKSKTIIFSDGLTPEAVEKIARFCRGKIKISFGIGTNFTNDVGVKPLNIVIKMSSAKPEKQAWVSTVKLSDTQGKHTGNEDTIKLCKGVLNI